jgi:hypothetical protein
MPIQDMRVIARMAATHFCGKFEMGAAPACAPGLVGATTQELQEYLLIAIKLTWGRHWMPEGTAATGHFDWLI